MKPARKWLQYRQKVFVYAEKILVYFEQFQCRSVRNKIPTKIPSYLHIQNFIYNIRMCEYILSKAEINLLRVAGIPIYGFFPKFQSKKVTKQWYFKAINVAHGIIFPTPAFNQPKWLLIEIRVFPKLASVMRKKHFPILSFWYASELLQFVR